MSNLDVDFEKLSDHEIAQFIAAHHDDFHETLDADKVDEITRALAAGTAIVRRSFGFALVHPLGTIRPNGIARVVPVLWYLYIAEGNRRKGHAGVLIRALTEAYANQKAIVLLCWGPDRCALFERSGFTLETTDANGWHTMSSAVS